MQEERPHAADPAAGLRPSPLFADLSAPPTTPMLVIDPDDGAILAANAAAAAFYGWTVDELTAMRVADTNVLPVEEVTSTLLHDRDGAPRHQLGVVLDRPADRRARDEAARATRDLSRMMESVNVGILLLDGEWRVSYLNPRGQELLGVEVSDLLGLDLREQYASELGRGFHRAYATAMMTGRTQTVVERLGPTGQWFEARAYPGRLGLVISFTDVTDRVEHRARTQHQARLERLAASARSHATELQAQHETRNAFLSAVSHELRTPMTVVHGLAETLTRRRDELDPGTRAQLEDALLDHSGRMAALLEQLLDVDRLARGALIAERSPVDLARLVVACVDASPVADRAALEVPERLEGRVDPVQFERIVVNLLGNAAKYAPDGTVWIRLREGLAGRVRLEVEDEGPGIAAEARDRVFEPFQRLHDDHPQPGTGVGLALVAEFARLHDGRAWIEDAVGTCVVVELDASESLVAVETAS